jgi:peptidoglycan/LPS O-acetylase OafA/YrhL
VNLFFLQLDSLKKSTLARFVVVAFFSIVAISFLVALGNGRIGLAVDSGFGERNLVGGLPRVFYGFSLGILLYKLLQTGRFGFVESAINRLPGKAYLLLFFCVLILTCPLWRGFGAAYYLLAVGTAAPALVLVGAVARCETSADLNICKFLGWLSYPIYCLHVPVIHIVKTVGGNIAERSVNETLISSALTIVLAILLTRLVDEPVRAWLGAGTRKFTADRPRTAADHSGEREIVANGN